MYTHVWVYICNNIFHILKCLKITLNVCVTVYVRGIRKLLYFGNSFINNVGISSLTILMPFVKSVLIKNLFFLYADSPARASHARRLISPAGSGLDFTTDQAVDPA